MRCATAGLAGDRHSLSVDRGDAFCPTAFRVTCSVAAMPFISRAVLSSEPHASGSRVARRYRRPSTRLYRRHPFRVALG
jgi:hypothetical protein